MRPDQRLTCSPGVETYGADTDPLSCSAPDPAGHAVCLVPSLPPPRPPRTCRFCILRAEDPALRCLRRRHRGRVCRQNGPGDLRPPEAPGSRAPGRAGSSYQASRRCRHGPRGTRRAVAGRPGQGLCLPDAVRPGASGSHVCGCASSEALSGKMQVGARIQALREGGPGRVSVVPGAPGALGAHGGVDS